MLEKETCVLQESEDHDDMYDVASMAGNINGHYKMVIQVSLTILAHLNFPSPLNPNCHGKATYFFVIVCAKSLSNAERHRLRKTAVFVILYQVKNVCIPRL